MLSPAAERYKKILSSPSQDFKSELRKLRHEHWIKAAEFSLTANKSTAKQICSDWSKATDKIVRLAWDHCELNKSSLALFALGKWGAQELNLSSDIDFFVVSKRPVNREDQKSFNYFLKLLNENNQFGFCYRTDIDLRPGGRFGPIINSLSQVQDYYWNSGATWEKVALVRLRYVCGDSSVKKEFQEIVEAFVFRRYLDYTLFEDLKHLRQKIHSSLIETENTNLKLYPGGIRDIELFINALQVIHGGRISSLRVTSTSEAIRIIAKNKLFPIDILDKLDKVYWELRDLENKAQASEDRQTHSSYIKDDARLVNEMEQVHNIISQLIGFKESDDSHIISGDDGKKWLSSLGFNKHSVEKVWPEILGLTSKSAKTERTEQARASFLKEFVLALSSRPIGKDLGLELLKEFIRSTRAKATFFTTLLRDPTLIKDLSYIFSSSAYIGNFVAARPELIDSLILRQESLDNLDLEDFLSNLVEKKKIRQIYSVINFLKNKDVNLLSRENSKIADNTCTELLCRLRKEMSIKSTLEIIALGKWGGNELGIGSDLDLIFVTAEKAQPADFKLAKRFLSRLSEQQKAGTLYTYDLRLRPSGNSGPLLVSKDQLQNYLKDESQPWEKQSFLRARPIFTDSKLHNLSNCYIDHGLTQEDEQELLDILDKLTSKTSSKSQVNLKYSKGGLVNIELVTQLILLKHKLKPEDSHLEDMFNVIESKFPDIRDSLSEILRNYSFLRLVEQMYQVKSSHSGSELNMESVSFEQVCLELDLSPELLINQINSCQDKNRELLKILSKV